MRLMPEWPWRRRAGDGVLAIMLGDNWLRYVFASEAGEHGAALASWGAETRGTQTRESFIKRARGSLPRARSATLVLASGDYQMLQLDAPNVPPDEVRAAARWRATEFLEGSPNDYTLDVLQVPSVAEGGTGKVIVFAVRNELLRRRMQDAEALGIAVSIVDVGETAQRNLLNAVLFIEQSPASVAGAIVADGGSASMIIAVKGELHFFRRFDFNVDLLAVPVEEAQPALVAQGEVAESASRSLTQLQRSLDLWDNTYAHLPLGTLRVHAGPKTTAIVDRVAAAAGVDTRPLALSGVLRVAAGKKSSPGDDPAYLPLLGALLRAREAA